MISASREDVFDAWTKPEIMQQWFFPGNWTAKTTNELKVGGHYSHDMISDGSEAVCDPNSSISEGEHYLHSGEYLEISRPERLVFTWNSPSVANTRVTVELREVENSTELTLTHELLDSEDQRNKHTAGWEGCLANLVQFLQ
jgi:uncharacterized protein YndB with AHSA1/START domain